jgi:acyl carrier protein
MAARVRNDERLARFGIDSITPERGIEAMRRALCQKSAQVWAIPINWPQLLQFDRVVAKSPWLDKLTRQVSPEVTLPTQQLEVPKGEILRQLKQHSARDRHSFLIAYIQGEVARVLGLDPSKLPNPQQGFFDMGIDSLMAVELKNRLELSLETSLPVTLTFEFPTIKDLAKYLAKEVMGWELPTTGNTSSAREDETEALSEVEQLSEDGVEASIEQELAKIETLLGK